MKKKKEPATAPKQLSAWKRWASAHPDKVQANRNAWAQSEAGKEWLRKNQAKKNKARDAWRKRKGRDLKTEIGRPKKL